MSKMVKAALMYRRNTAICSVCGCAGFMKRRRCSTDTSLAGGTGERGLPRSGRELAAGGVDVGAAVAPDRGIDARGDEPVSEGAHPGWGRTSGGEAGCGVERAEVHVGSETPGQAGQLGRVGRAVVHPVA